MKTKEILREYIKELKPGAKILDIGCGEGGSAIFLAKQGFKVAALDNDEKLLRVLSDKIAENAGQLNIEIINDDIRRYEIQENYFDAILALNSLIFVKKTEFTDVINKVKNGLKQNGLIFISLFTEEDPTFAGLSKNKEPVETDTFYNEKDGKFWQFMKADELKEIFNDFQTLYYKEGIVQDLLPAPHQHGLVFYVGKKSAN